MAQWIYYITLKDLLDEDESDAGAQRAGKAMAGRILASPAFINAHRLAVQFELVQTCGEFNRVMSDMYDAADRQRIWIN